MDISDISKLKCKKLYNLTRQFVRKYYETLHSNLNVLHKFYDQDAILCHLEDEDHIVQYFIGIYQIKDYLKLKHWKHCKIVIDRIDHQPLCGSNSSKCFLDFVLICVHGYLFQNNCLRGKRFSQSFVICKNRKNFYVVKNDILRFLPYWHPINGKPRQIQTKLNSPDLYTLEENLTINHFGDTEYHIFNFLNDPHYESEINYNSGINFTERQKLKEEIFEKKNVLTSIPNKVPNKPLPKINQKIPYDDWIDMHSENLKHAVKSKNMFNCDSTKLKDFKKKKYVSERSNSKYCSQSSQIEETATLQKPNHDSWSKVVSAINNEQQKNQSNFEMKSNKSIVKNRHIDRWKQKHPKKHPINNEKKSNHEKRSRDKGECRNIRKGGNNKNEYYEKAVKGKKKNYRQDKKDGYRVNKNFDDIKGVSYQREEKQYDIYIRNIPHDCTKDELKDVLSHYGPVSDIDIRIRKVGDHRYGLASFKDSSVGGKIIQEAHENLVK